MRRFVPTFTTLAMSFIAYFFPIALQVSCGADDQGRAVEWAEPREGDAARVRSRRWPGEFERQETLLLACRDVIAKRPELLSDILSATAGRIEVGIVVSGDEQRAAVSRALAQHRFSADRVRWVVAPHTTMWLRDFGPLVVRESGRSVAVDPEYLPGRPSDDQVPAELARLWRLPKDSAAIALEGGNLLTNGQGLLVATRSVQDMNAGVGRNEAYVRQVLAQHLGAREAVFLEPLAGEPTGHVDLFASFCSSETVIVGSYEKSEDAENAAILDRNAEVLRKTRTSRGVLRVVRIPMPSHGDGVWRTYTNVVYANGVVLVPSFAEKGRDVEARAMSAFAKELPGWRVVSIDAECLAELGGGLRCITMTLPSETDETKKPSP